MFDYLRNKAKALGADVSDSSRSISRKVNSSLNTFMTDLAFQRDGPLQKNLDAQKPLAGQFVKSALFKKERSANNWNERWAILDLEEKKIKYGASSTDEKKFVKFVDLELMTSYKPFEVQAKTYISKSIPTYGFEITLHGAKFSFSARTESDRADWLLALEIVFTHNMSNQNFDTKLLEMFKATDVDASGALSVIELHKLTVSLGMFINISAIKDCFRLIKKDVTAELTYQEFVKILEIMRTRQDLQEQFQKLNGGQPIPAPKLMDWIHRIQREPTTTLEQTRQIIKISNAAAGSHHFAKESDALASSEEMTALGFQTWLTSPNLNPICSTTEQEVFMDMSHPLPHYFIASSHNTYLLGDQLAGESSVQAYINALKVSCRCVELDCWDSERGEPVIYHGHTLTSKILFKDVVQAIKEYAFISSPYPVILSIENHCSIPFQDKMAKYLKEILGDMLPPPFPKDAKKLPSPNELKYKVLVKGKILKEKDLSSDQPATTSKALSDVTHLNSGGLKIPAPAMPAWEMSSVAESKVAEILEDYALSAKLNSQLNNMLLRTYPSGTRIDSSNYEVQYGWLVGAQIVALNYQTVDQPMLINNCFFENNGKSGYVLKPKEMLDGVYSISNTLPAKVTLNITVLSGHQLPQASMVSDSVNPSVVVNLIGLGTDSKVCQTETIYDNGFNPKWKQNNFTFPLAYPEYALLFIKVKESEGNYSSCLNCLQVSRLQSGFRTIPLLRADKFTPLPASTLLVYISMTTPRKF